LLALALQACTKTIDEGTYGPFLIGESKETCLESLKQLHVLVKAQPEESIVLDNPSPSELQRLLGSTGVLVWIQSNPQPLKVEFAKDRVDAVIVPESPPGSVEPFRFLHVGVESIRKRNQTGHESGGIPRGSQ
jgi:hypothetical protein